MSNFEFDQETKKELRSYAKNLLLELYQELKTPEAKEEVKSIYAIFTKVPEKPLVTTTVEEIKEYEFPSY